MSKMDELIKDTNKKMGEEIMTFGLSDYDYERIPFTSPYMNYCTFGGVPVGKITEFYGEEHGGKTTSALDIVANFQALQMQLDEDKRRKVLYIDAENTLDVVWAKKLSVSVDDLYILQPKGQSAEQIFQIICDAVETDEVGLWVLDSIGALMSQQEWDKTMEDKSYGGVSKPLTMFVKKVEQLMHKHRCTGIGINQLRDKLNSPIGGTTTTGGWGWKYLCSVRMEFRRGSFVDEDGKEIKRGSENPQGNIVLMSMTKNKTCPPTRRIGWYTLNYHKGIDYLKDLVDVCLKYDIVDKHGSWFTIVDIESGEILVDKLQGKPNVYKALEEDVDVLARIEELVDMKFKEEEDAE